METIVRDQAVRIAFRKEVLVYGDKEKDTDKLCKLIRDADDSVKIYRTSRIEEAYRTVFERNLTAVFIWTVFDKNGDSEGMDLIHTIKKIEAMTFIPVILITHEELNLRYFLGELHCFGILDTEYEETHAKKLIKEALRYPVARMKKESASFKKAGVVYTVPISDILYTEHHKDHTMIITLHDRLKIGACSCQEMLSKFEFCDFLICARGIVVNMRRVKKVDMKKHTLFFYDSDEILTYGKNFAGSIQAYLEQETVL